MSKISLNMEMGNLICRFGNKKVLLDLVNEIVLPSFLDDSLVRSYSKTDYFFHNVKPVLLNEESDEPVVAVIGRLIKDTTLEREQVFEKGKGIVQKSGEMASAPSAIFLLILNNHRLIYVRETKNAPKMETFRSTLLSFLREKHKSYIEASYEEKKPKKVTKNKLLEEIPKPTVELIPLTSGEGIEAFVKKYDVLKSVEISLSDRNDESDNDPFFEALQKRKDAVGSKKSTIVHNNSKGLDKEEVIVEISEATEQGNQVVKLNGVDSSGDVLRGNNEEFQLRKPIDKISSSNKRAANELFETFQELIEDNLVKVPKTSRKAKRIIGSLVQRLF
ncbi:hypothetical protein M3P05_20085 [Sansalvadorimonas sp. 2012CJ34-2]|uniref:Uncharacterized protein n=1 Tax=Parendozoicomonas callyspongiae TaxID=2942213 RepID=A0ABT0PLG0_9GAMM|nr:hypothetical protein [Sansalvadorimonas sp. 2012CJ34-2]MCL6272225.1 hypothetical protein [Sansalvadorimonas sp. 2012CJ34-2]